MDRQTRQMRCLASNYTVREAADELYIEGYFAVFNNNYELWQGATESIAPGTFIKTIERDDIRALIDHESRLVIGRNKAGTLVLREDEHGLWGSVKVNPKDLDAMNVRARVGRGDVDQCSIGFEIVKEDTEIREDGSVHWTIREVKLWEVSVVTFPAYEETSVKARKDEYAEILKRKNDKWREEMNTRLKGVKHGT